MSYATIAETENIRALGARVSNMCLVWNKKVQGDGTCKELRLMLEDLESMHCALLSNMERLIGADELAATLMVSELETTIEIAENFIRKAEESDGIGATLERLCADHRRGNQSNAARILELYRKYDSTPEGARRFARIPSSVVEEVVGQLMCNEEIVRAAAQADEQLVRECACDVAMPAPAPAPVMRGRLLTYQDERDSVDRRGYIEFLEQELFGTVAGMGEREREREGERERERVAQIAEDAACAQALAIALEAGDV